MAGPTPTRLPVDKDGSAGSVHSSGWSIQRPLGLTSSWQFWGLVVPPFCARPDISGIGTCNLEFIAECAFPLDDFAWNLLVYSPKRPATIVTEEETPTHKFLRELEARPQPFVSLHESDLTSAVASEERPKKISGSWTQKSVKGQIEASQFRRDRDAQFSFCRGEAAFVAGRSEVVACEELFHGFGCHRASAK
jgi:hypothetical protein